ncbi:hypothetical protein [Paeniglutamicibacter kerguelensis]|uniref:Bacterial Ig domain-containing protein n=1 Tax=Paeniglutamicibacter kerguelensis TaxID=254788 RepID=A0ABS4XG20_9MICC|nr:hypothetical protein [Paeniglutamicibacter kerguelensis]MBP2387405.1 hypothetical protein [Paeniglutamicibacter kerguelensis]
MKNRIGRATAAIIAASSLVLGGASVATAAPAPASTVKAHKSVAATSHKSESKPTVVIRDTKNKTVEADELATITPKVKVGKQAKVVSKTLTVSQDGTVLVDGKKKAKLGVGTYEVTTKVEYRTLVKQVVVKVKSKGKKVKKVKKNVWSEIQTESKTQTLVVSLGSEDKD